MRIWHTDLIPYLPRTQLLAQWRELNSIFKKQDKHILINYVYEQPRELYLFTEKVIDEMNKRNYKIKSLDNFKKYFANKDIIIFNSKKTFKEHDKDYLTICYYNLLEKCMRGQKDFTLDIWYKLDSFYKKEMSK